MVGAGGHTERAIMISLKVQPVTEEEEQGIPSIQSTPSGAVQLPPLQKSPATAQKEEPARRKCQKGGALLTSRPRW